MVKPRYKGRCSINPSRASTNPDRIGGAGGNNMRDRATIRRLNMYRQKERRNKHGKVIKPLQFQSTVAPGTVARVEPNIKWFGNTRVIKQSSLQKFQEEMETVMKDPYRVVMKQRKLPMSLFHDRIKPHTSRVHILDTETFETTFGPKSQRKRPTLSASDVQALVENAEASSESYDQDKDRDLVTEDTGVRDEAQEEIFKKGQSRRIWGELYKVIDSSDVVVQVLDARDPMGTRSPHVESYLKKEKHWKHLIFVLNKCDLVPTWATKRWVAVLSQEYPTLAFHASLTNPFGKGAFIQLLRQFGKVQNNSGDLCGWGGAVSVWCFALLGFGAQCCSGDSVPPRCTRTVLSPQLHSDKKQISVGFIGYPNVGKSSVINTLRSKKVCNVAPIAGETKVWQYITLMRRIFLIDCPGVVYPSGDTETDIVLKGVVQVEKIKSPEDHISAVLERAKAEYIRKTYKIDSWKDTEDFLEKLAARTGKLLKGGEPDLQTVSKMVLNDWQRGRIPFFVKPPNAEPGEPGSQPPALEAAVTSSQDNTEEKVSESMASSVEPEERNNPDTEIRQLMSHVRQNFGRINVAPQFSEEDLVPVDVPGFDETDSDSCGEEEQEEEKEENEQQQDAGEEESQVAAPARESSKAVLKALEDKIAKYKKFLDKAKAKRFSAIRIPKGLSDKVFAKSMQKAEEPKETEDGGSTEKKRKRKAEEGGDDDDQLGTQPCKKLTSKERRRAERQQRSKKVGVRYYETHNVKNKNKNKKKTGLEEQRSKHKKYKHKQ
ncbi:nucleolar GTP-binding protein 2 isoform X1 [Neopelma chrysocephalum]|uniref:nucleolar GTP-binding protein 2 isoform X1 n=1 Tax=Neopelma chrysocephalum TaxID=114329 RepID=UPI000FCD4BBA|nr:nucleolar GTP-binding protein 2 isoform X1 [Neopelma chrysocephalum]XP_027557063.1 nucleolar GTP-binding protein 2 isoform X1 [Neopelma chrysocephalum]XP_027557066.1 nucleolar GTP-binding protein 2 isoform X1 [Neopelma chrysocephalum]